MCLHLLIYFVASKLYFLIQKGEIKPDDFGEVQKVKSQKE